MKVQGLMLCLCAEPPPPPHSKQEAPVLSPPPLRRGLPVGQACEAAAGGNQRWRRCGGGIFSSESCCVQVLFKIIPECDPEHGHVLVLVHV